MCDVYHVIDWNMFFEMSHSELLDLYNEQKSQGKTVFIKGSGQYSGYWKLDNKGDIVLVGNKI